MIHSRAVSAPYVVTIVIACGVCWLTFIHGLHLTFEDMFGGPPPPETNIYFALACLAGLTVEIAGLMYFVRRKTFVIKTLLPALGIGLMMFATVLPVTYSNFVAA